MCTYCDLKNGEKVTILDCSITNHKAFIEIENVEGVFRLRMNNNIFYTTREILYCPYCGRDLFK